MSEVAGRMAIQVGAQCLEKEQGGAGMLLGGVPGVAPAQGGRSSAAASSAPTRRAWPSGLEAPCHGPRPIPGAPRRARRCNSAPS